MNRLTSNFTRRSALFTAVLLVVISTPLSAQIYGDNRSNDYVTVYQDCDFRGAARNIPVGDYQDMRAVQMQNDSISSMQVPDGLELTIYQHDRYGGFSATHRQDVRCLDSAWNDQISSLKVSASRSPGFDGNNSGYYTNYDVNGNNVERVGFAGVILQKDAERQWSLTNQNGQTGNFRELSKNQNAVYLEGLNNGQKLRVDFFTQEVTIVAPNGEQASYGITQSLRLKNRNQNNRDHRNNRVLGAEPAAPAVAKVPTVRGRCFNYTAYTDGGDGSLRFRGHEEDPGLLRLGSKPTNGRLCHNGLLVFEVGKRDLKTDVVLEIQGQKFRFAPNSEYEQLRNSWYRNWIEINVGG